MVLLRAEQVREVVRLGPADNVPDRVHAPALHRARVVRAAMAERVVRRAKVAQRPASQNTAIGRRVRVLLARAARELVRAAMVRRRAVVPRAVMTVLLVVRPANVVSGNHMVNVVSASPTASAANASLTANAVSGNHTVSVRVARRVRVLLDRAARELVRAAREPVRAAMVTRRAVAPRAVTTPLLAVHRANVVSGNHMVNVVSASHTANAVSGNHTASAVNASPTVSVRVARRVHVLLVRAARELVRAATTIEVRVVMIARFARRLSNVR
ncbi:MAG: hypothetical protein KGQ43_07575 [Acidobacteria bacterium]|nr:hypothetical protein [Acidobacteriota bacterium]